MLVHGNAALLALADGTVHACVTSPAYYRARKYDCKTWWEPVTFRPDPHLAEEWHVGEWYGELGWEPHVLDFIGHLIAVFREVKRTLRGDGSLWVNIGDKRTDDRQWHGVPDLLCRALVADGWRWEDLVLWQKPSCMPGSQTNRFTRDFEHIFVFNLSKDDVFFDVDGVREPSNTEGGITWEERKAAGEGPRRGFNRNRPLAAGGTMAANPAGRTRRTTWSINPRGYDGAHYATWPLELVTIMLQAATSARGCCVSCGRPWRRVTEKGLNIHPGSSHDHTRDTEQGNTQIHKSGKPAGTIMAQRWHAKTPDRTIAWHPSCTCYGTPMRGPVRCSRCGGTGRERALQAAGKTESSYAIGTNANRLSLLRQAARKAGQEYDSSFQGVETGASCPHCTDGWAEGDIWPDDVDTWPVAPSIALDPFAGSGTTGLACRKLTLAGHPLQFVGVDLQGKYLVEQALPRAEGKTSALAVAELPLFAAAEGAGQ